MHTQISLALALVASSGCLAQSADPGAIERMYKHYAELPGASLTLGIQMKTDDPVLAQMVGSMNQTQVGYAIKPSSFAFWHEEAPSEGMMDLFAHSDGRTLTTAAPSMSVYSQTDAPEDLGQLADQQVDDETGLNMIPGSHFVFALMSTDPKASFESLLNDIEYEGLVGEGDDAFHAYNSTDPDGTAMQVRIAAAGEPWLVALRPDLSGSGAPEGLELLLAFDEWESISETPADNGAIDIDEEWKQADNLTEAIMGQMMADAEAEAAPGSPGVAEGDAAPDFALDLLDSEDTFSLAAHRGQVVVLDFWATWCGPCIRGLPTMTSVTGEFADRGVVFAAVNLRERSDQVAKFMRDKDWSFAVPMDTNGAVAESYGVSGIPHSVIIDKKGNIRHVHVGFGNPDATAKRLRNELEALVSE